MLNFPYRLFDLVSSACSCCSFVLTVRNQLRSDVCLDSFVLRIGSVFFHIGYRIDVGIEFRTCVFMIDVSYAQTLILVNLLVVNLFSFF